MGALAVGDELLIARDHRIFVLAARGRGHRVVVFWCFAERRRYRCHREPTGQRDAAFQDISAAILFGTHRSLLRNRTHRSLLRKMRRDEITSRRKRVYAICQPWPALMSRRLGIFRRRLVRRLTAAWRVGCIMSRW